MNSCNLNQRAVESNSFHHVHGKTAKGSLWREKTGAGMQRERKVKNIHVPQVDPTSVLSMEALPKTKLPHFGNSFVIH